MARNRDGLTYPEDWLAGGRAIYDSYRGEPKSATMENLIILACRQRDRVDRLKREYGKIVRGEIVQVKEENPKKNTDSIDGEDDGSPRYVVVVDALMPEMRNHEDLLRKTLNDVERHRINAVKLIRQEKDNGDSYYIDGKEKAFSEIIGAQNFKGETDPV